MKANVKFESEMMKEKNIVWLRTASNKTLVNNH